ncbi:MAG: hypothetical protein IPK32_15945 [Verrucomicrobiaceae bacterium]|nr:hypothetical protein [Verrucomicrobiaceae bacterium]
MKSLSGVKKKIIYLDQCLLSRMVKMLDPDFPESRKLQPSFDLGFVRAAFEKLHQLVKLQLIVCPESPFHRLESSILDPEKPAAFAQHKRVWELLSGRTSFHYWDSIRNAQVIECADAWLGGASVSGINQIHAVTGRLHDWPKNKFNITLNWYPSVEEKEGNKNQGEHYRKKISSLYAGWLRDKPSFRTMYEKELRALGDSTRQLYIKVLGLRLKTNEGDPAAENEFFNLMMGSELRLLRELRERFERHVDTKGDALSTALIFLTSGEVSGCPYIQLSSLMYAEISQRVIGGNWRLDNDMPLNDVSAIAAYLPYCDAIFVDSQMHGLLKSKRVRGLSYCKALVHSTDNKGEFIAYLDSILNEAPEEHLEIVKRLYGERWLEPYFDVLKHDKARQAEDDEE